MSMKHLAASNMPLVIYYLVVPLLATALVVGMELSSPPVPSATTQVGCPSMCGNISVPYPFGIGKGCSWNDSFNFYCNRRYNPPRLYYAKGFEIMDIKLDAGEMRVFSYIAHICYSSSSTINSTSKFRHDFAKSSAFVISPTRNQFTGVGCHNVALLKGKDRNDVGGYLSGCITTCASLDDAAEDGDPCSGNGCCQTAMPSGLNSVDVGWSIGKTSPVNTAWKYSSCSYGFIAEKEWYNFSRKHLNGTGEMSFHGQMGKRKVPLVLDWSIRNNGSCQRTPMGTLTAPACVSANSTCVNVDITHGTAYRCNCSEGYQGNPYLSGSGGCTDIDECALREQFPKKYEKMYPCGRATICRNIPGNYTCECKFGHVADPKNEGDCQPIFPGYATAILVTVVSSVVLGLLLYVLHTEHQRRVRRGFFDKNGGEILKRMNIKTFTELELEKMTNHYSELIGKGYFGKVFNGTITENNQRVAVKCPILDGSKKKNQQNNGEEFVGEIIFQFKISHANLVRLIGCCLETNVPCLVFEFISNGSLYNELHGGSKSRRLSLTQRLDIAIGSAEAVSYMHSNGDHKHVHGDIKSANILLDGDLMPKVSDFGSSKLLSIDMYAHAVAADRNYVDPVYMKTDRFTTKSDVYSFGIVLLELITRKKAMYDGSNSLPINFVKCCKEEGNGRKMYDTDLLTGDDDARSHVYIECLDRIGGLAVRCLKEDIDERPTMAEVLEELKQVKLRTWK